MFHSSSRSDPEDHLPSLQILASELEAFKRTGKPLHLLHAARALDDARTELRQLLHLKFQPIDPRAPQGSPSHEH